MAVKIPSFKASVKRFAKKVAKAYTIDPEERVHSDNGGTECTAMCVLISEDGYKKPACLNHPSREMEMENLMKSEVEKQTWRKEREKEGGMRGGLRGGCFYASEDEDEEDEWSEKALCEAYDWYANFSLAIESLEEDLYMEEMERSGALYLAFENVDGEVEVSFTEQEKMRTKLIQRIQKWLSMVEVSDDGKMLRENMCSDDMASVFTVKTLVAEVTCVFEEEGDEETLDWLEENESVEKDDNSSSV